MDKILTWIAAACFYVVLVLGSITLCVFMVKGIIWAFTN